MKKMFYIGLLGLGLFEILRVYFIMPMPGSQEMESIDVAYFLHTYRWYVRALFGIMIVLGCARAFRVKRWWLPVIPDRKSTRLNSSHLVISYAVFCLKKKNITTKK